MFHAYACKPGEAAAAEVPREEVAARLADGQSNLWVDISEPGPDEFAFLRDALHLHPLAIEDLQHPRMLPKVEEYDGCLFLILHDIVLQYKDEEERLRTYELYLFLGKHFVATVRHRRIRAVESYHGELRTLAHLFTRGPEGVAHAILRKMIDSYFPMLDRVEQKLDDAEETIFDSPTTQDLQAIFALRKDVVKLRSIAVQQLDVVNRMALGEFEALSPHGLLLARDLYDHLYRLSEKASGFRELTMGLLDAYLSQVNNRMNEVMKVLTIIATIMLPLGIVVGFYGMNFKWMPGLQHPHGWLFALGGMLAIVVGMMGFFKHKKWW